MTSVVPTKFDGRTSFEGARLRHVAPSAHEQGGIVLVITMIMLIIFSLLATTTMRNASSSERISGNVRTTELATQAAEIALRHCESSATKVAKYNGGDTTTLQATYSTTFTSSKIAPVGTNAWKTISNWDTEEYFPP